MKCVNVFWTVVLVVGAIQSTAGQAAEGPSQRRASRDQLRIAIQEICPVSGRKLGTHGSPVKVQIGQETAFLCCKGCTQRKVDAKHWATIHANIARAQSKCPVMGKALPSGAKWTIVQGQIVYVCCQPCTKKIEADPAAYLRKVDELYAASLQAARSPR